MLESLQSELANLTAGDWVTWSALILAILAIVQNFWIYIKARRWSSSTEANLGEALTVLGVVDEATRRLGANMSLIHDVLVPGASSEAVVAPSGIETEVAPDREEVRLAMLGAAARRTDQGAISTVSDLVLHPLVPGSYREHFTVLLLLIEEGELVLDGPLRGETRVYRSD